MELLTVDELSKILRASRNQVVLMARRGEIPALSIAGKLLFDADEIEKWLKQDWLWGLALKSKRFPDYRIRDKRTGRAFRSQIAEAKGNFLTEEGTVVTRFFYKGPSRRLQFDYVGPARVFLRLVLVFSLVIILWKVLS